jgi:hypothetical protein
LSPRGTSSVPPDVRTGVCLIIPNECG